MQTGTGGKNCFVVVIILVHILNGSSMEWNVCIVQHTRNLSRYLLNNSFRRASSLV